MCTAITLKTKDSYFGRNLDLEYSYNETITITPRNYEFDFGDTGKDNNHYAMIGMAYVKDNYPLYYDATNEKGLSMAGLNFPENAHYYDKRDGKINISPFEFIPFVLCKCETISEVKALLLSINLVNVNFSDDLPLSPLHWIIADKEESIVVECVKTGMKIFDNPVGVLTNNPTFDMQMFNLNNYMHLSNKEPENKFMKGLNYYSRGMGAIGLPGDWSSMSRFVKAVFVKNYSVSACDEIESVSQFFHILSSVEMPRGSIKIGEKNDITIYSSCCNVNKGIYYYKTYDNSQITAVRMFNEKLDSYTLINYPLLRKTQIAMQN